MPKPKPKSPLSPSAVAAGAKPEGAPPIPAGFPITVVPAAKPKLIQLKADAWTPGEMLGILNALDETHTGTDTARGLLRIASLGTDAGKLADRAADEITGAFLRANPSADVPAGDASIFAFFAAADAVSTMPGFGLVRTAGDLRAIANGNKDAESFLRSDAAVTGADLRALAKAFDSVRNAVRYGFKAARTPKTWRDKLGPALRAAYREGASWDDVIAAANETWAKCHEAASEGATAPATDPHAPVLTPVVEND